MRKLLIILSYILACTLHYTYAQQLKPLTERVNVQTDSACIAQIIDEQWVAVGTDKPHTIQLDYTHLFNHRPSYRFELRAEDNSLQGYAAGETKGRAELCQCYAVHSDFKNLPSEIYDQAQKLKTVYHHGKGSCPQGASRSYTFSIYVPDTLQEEVTAIFAQWHGMPSRTLVSNPNGQVMRLSPQEFLELEQNMIFKKDTGYEKIARPQKQGKTTYKTGKPNGWKIEQGGYPPLAFGFSQGYFYIKANSDRKWFTDKSDRCNANVATTPILHPQTSQYKTSTIAYKEPLKKFPRNCWVTFQVDVRWTTYSQESEQVITPGRLHVEMSYPSHQQTVRKTLVNHQNLLIGRNDEEGYYFKFGIYRVGNSTIPVCYNLAGYEEKDVSPFTFSH